MISTLIKLFNEDFNERQNTMKQTIEEATVKYITDNCNINDYDMINAVGKAHTAGAAWQKEQGIDWISVSHDLPIIKDEFATPILITDGNTFNVWYLIYDRKLITGSFKTTHWAYINTPKTD